MLAESALIQWINVQPYSLICTKRLLFCREGGRLITYEAAPFAT